MRFLRLKNESFIDNSIERIQFYSITKRKEVTKMGLEIEIVTIDLDKNIKANISGYLKNQSDFNKLADKLSDRELDATIASIELIQSN